MASSLKSTNYIHIINKLAPELSLLSPGAYNYQVAVIQHINIILHIPPPGNELHSAVVPALRHVIRLGQEASPGMDNFESFMEPLGGGIVHQDFNQDILDNISNQLQFDDAINIQFTSGTTGHPKGATLSHHNILNNAYFIGEHIGLQPGEKVCIPVPLYHCFGMVIGNLACMTHGATMVYPNDTFDAEATLRTVQEERCSALYGVPTMVIAELEHPRFKQYDLSSLRTGVLAGSLVPSHIMQRVQSEMHMHEVTICYGMTETSPVSTQTGRADPLHKRVTTVGRVHPHVELKIVDSEGRIVSRGQTGELLTRGYCVMKGYWGDAVRTAEVLTADGWMRTGDLAAMDEEGYVSVEGRLKDMVIRGGMGGGRVPMGLLGGDAVCTLCEHCVVV